MKRCWTDIYDYYIEQEWIHGVGVLSKSSSDGDNSKGRARTSRRSYGSVVLSRAGEQAQRMEQTSIVRCYYIYELHRAEPIEPAVYGNMLSE